MLQTLPNTLKEDGDNMAVISFLNYKGGVGKTNVSVNFAAHCAQSGKSTLLIDWDPQGDSTEYIGFGRENVEVTVYDFLADNLHPEIGVNILPTQIDNLSIIGANSSLKNVEHLVSQNENTFDQFRELVTECSRMFDVVVIDCPPANSHVNIASIFASTHLFIVSTSASDSIDKIGLVDKMISDIGSVIEENQENTEQYAAPSLGGIILTMAVENTVGLDVAQEHLRAVWGDKLIDPAIPRTVAASYSVSENIPLMVSKPRTKIAIRYRKVFEEVLNRVN